MKSPSLAGAPRVAVLIPCYNEPLAIASVVRGFRAALPDADIYVYDNNSFEGTAEVARRTGAIVRAETLQGKGHVVRRMFCDVEADSTSSLMATVPTTQRWRPPCSPSPERGHTT